MGKIGLIYAGVFAGIIAASSSVVSAEKESGSGPNPYSDCGIGSALFTETKWAAVTSNVIWDVGTTAVTSATASPETCSGKKAETAQFIIDNYDNIAEETAKGQGEHLTAMLKILACQAGFHSDIISGVRQNMANIVSQPNYVDHDLVIRASNYYDALNSTVEGKFAESCSA